MRGDCEAVEQSLPRLVGGSLPEAERRSALDHLLVCQRCRDDLEDTVLAFGTLSQHVPSFELAAYSLGWQGSGLSDERIERHLDTCESCRQEYETTLQGRLVAFEPAIEKQAGQDVPGRRSWRAVAAALFALLAIGGGWRFLPTPESDSIEARSGQVPSLYQEQDGGTVSALQGSANEETSVVRDSLFLNGFEGGNLSEWEPATRIQAN